MRRARTARSSPKMAPRLHRPVGGDPPERLRRPGGAPPGLVTQVTPWEDWFGTFTQRTVRLKLETGGRELQIHSLDPGAWVEPREIEEIFNPKLDPDPQKGSWVDWYRK